MATRKTTNNNRNTQKISINIIQEQLKVARSRVREAQKGARGAEKLEDKANRQAVQLSGLRAQVKSLTQRAKDLTRDLGVANTAKDGFQNAAGTVQGQYQQLNTQLQTLSNDLKTTTEEAKQYFAAQKVAEGTLTIYTGKIVPGLETDKTYLKDALTSKDKEYTAAKDNEVKAVKDAGDARADKAKAEAEKAAEAAKVADLTTALQDALVKLGTAVNEAKAHEITGTVAEQRRVDLDRIYTELKTRSGDLETALKTAQGDARTQDVARAEEAARAELQKERADDYKARADKYEGKYVGHLEGENKTRGMLGYIVTGAAVVAIATAAYLMGGRNAPAPQSPPAIEHKAEDKSSSKTDSTPKMETPYVANPVHSIETHMGTENYVIIKSRALGAPEHITQVPIDANAVSAYNTLVQLAQQHDGTVYMPNDYEKLVRKLPDFDASGEKGRIVLADVNRAFDKIKDKGGLKELVGE